MTDKQNNPDPITHAARLLREAAEELRQAHTLSTDRNNWIGEPEAKAAYDEHLAAAQALEDWEAAVGAGGVQALSAAPAIKPLVWSDESGPTDRIRYNHITAETALGQFSVEWKGRKEEDVPCVYLAGDYIGVASDLGGAKQLAERHIRELVANLLAASPTPPALSAAPAIGDELRDTLVAVSAAIAERDDRAAQKMICEILAASTTPPAEQQAQPGAVYAELPQPDSWFHFTAQFWENKLCDFADRTHALRMQPTPKAARTPHLLAADHKGMRVDYSGLLSQCRRALQSREPANAEMLRQFQGHLQELGRRWYAGDTVAVDEFLQLYCIEHEARVALAAQGGQ